MGDDGKETRPRRGFFNPGTGHFIPFKGHKTEKRFREDLRFKARVIGTMIVLMITIVAIGIAWTFLRELLR